LQLKFSSISEYPQIPYEFQRDLVNNIQKQLWQQLSFPHGTKIRQLTFDILLSVESIQSLSVEEVVKDMYYTPRITCTPSIVDQVIYRPLTILDPYILSLQHNYYPIAQDFPTMVEDEDITDLIKEIDSHEPPTQSEGCISSVRNCKQLQIFYNIIQNMFCSMLQNIITCFET
jgi:hypothetical protein